MFLFSFFRSALLCFWFLDVFGSLVVSGGVSLFVFSCCCCFDVYSFCMHVFFFFCMVCIFIVWLTNYINIDCYFCFCVFSICV